MARLAKMAASRAMRDMDLWLRERVDSAVAILLADAFVN
jgi:hypothetical protein